ncbi:MAG: hypothetical protein U0T82_00525 [Bacteroidales bacterium]
MEDYKKQLEDLEHIRSMMERSSRFISLSGLSGVSAGLVALAGAAVAWFGLQFDQRYFDPDQYFLHTRDTLSHPYLFLALDGLVVLIMAIILAYWFTLRNARKKGVSIWDPATRRVIFHLGIPLLAGGLFCLILAYHELGWLCAPVTLLFYGIGLISASKYTFAEVGYLGAAEIALGLLASFKPGYGLIFWAIGFGILHIIYGIYTWRKYEAGDKNNLAV